MSIEERWWRFCLVGAAGAAVQLGTLMFLQRFAGVHYLLASLVALEVTLGHNFVWHQRFTWRERREEEDALSRWWRFQAGNGCVSVLGSMGLLPLLVHRLHAPVLIADAATIPCCALLNFCLSEGWAFKAPHTGRLATSRGGDGRGP